VPAISINSLIELYLTLNCLLAPRRAFVMSIPNNDNADVQMNNLPKETKQRVPRPISHMTTPKRSLVTSSVTCRHPPPFFLRQVTHSTTPTFVLYHQYQNMLRLNRVYHQVSSLSKKYFNRSSTYMQQCNNALIDRGLPGLKMLNGRSLDGTAESNSPATLEFKLPSSFHTRSGFVKEPFADVEEKTQNAQSLASEATYFNVHNLKKMSQMFKRYERSLKRLVTRARTPTNLALSQTLASGKVFLGILGSKWHWRVISCPDACQMKVVHFVWQYETPSNAEGARVEGPGQSSPRKMIEIMMPLFMWVVFVLTRQWV